MLIYIIIIVTCIVYFVYKWNSEHRIVKATHEKLYTKEELNQGIDTFRNWFNKHYVETDLPVWHIEGEALNELYELMDEKFAILISELNGTPITKLVGTEYNNYTIRVR